MKIADRFTTRDDLAEALSKLTTRATVIAPTRSAQGDVHFLPITEGKEITFIADGESPFGRANPYNSPKEFFFPDSERLFSFDPAAGHKSIEVPEPAEESIVFFGLHACDVAAVNLMRKFYSRDFLDTYVLQRLRQMTFISVGCTAVCERGFCNATGSGPFLDRDFDLQLVPLEDNQILVQIGSEAGVALNRRLRFKKAMPEQSQAAKELIAEANGTEPAFDLARVHAALKSGMRQELLSDIADRCQSCGLCLFICPTCSCYTVHDRASALDDTAARVRQWDACYFRGFTRLAGGYDPIKSRQAMVQRKYQHKLLQQIDEFGMSGCTGCGRCNDCCVGNVHWLNNIRQIGE